MTLTILPDFVEENWLSMEYCAERLLAELPQAQRRSPPYRRMATQFSSNRKAINADRAFNRYLLYPRFVRRLRREGFFHIVDHSYAHLAHSLPGERTGIYCHDLDAFRGSLQPERSSRVTRRLSHYLLTGLQRAALVFVNSQQTLDELCQHKLIASEKIVLAPLGVAEEFTANPDSTTPAFLAPLQTKPWILHVGSCVPRKRIDVLLNAFAEARRSLPELHLLKVSGEFSSAHQAQIENLGLRDAITHVRGLTRNELAAAYRAAPLVVIPSESEGFGLPALEAVACGAKVLASDLPALREAGGPAAMYVPIGDVGVWSRMMRSAFDEPALWPHPAIRAAHAARFTWKSHASIIAAAYETLEVQGTPR